MAWQAHIPWATRLLLKLPFATDAIVKFRDFTITCATKRKARGANVKDLFYHLVSLYGMTCVLSALFNSEEYTINYFYFFRARLHLTRIMKIPKIPTSPLTLLSPMSLPTVKLQSSLAQTRPPLRSRAFSIIFLAILNTTSACRRR